MLHEHALVAQPGVGRGTFACCCDGIAKAARWQCVWSKEIRAAGMGGWFRLGVAVQQAGQLKRGGGGDAADGDRLKRAFEDI